MKILKITRKKHDNTRKTFFFGGKWYTIEPSDELWFFSNSFRAYLTHVFYEKM